MSENNKYVFDRKRKDLNALVSAVFRVTDRFPEDEILRTRLREQALNILNHAEHAYLGDDDYIKKFTASIRTLISYCELAQKQNWLDKSNFEVLKSAFFNFLNNFQEINKRPKNLESVKFSLPKTKREPVKDSSSFTHRQESILGYIRRNKKTHVAQLADMLPEISARTIRRDLDVLVGSGLVLKKGKTNGTVYQLV